MLGVSDSGKRIEINRERGIKLSCMSVAFFEKIKFVDSLIDPFVLIVIVKLKYIENID